MHEIWLIFDDKVRKETVNLNILGNTLWLLTKNTLVLGEFLSLETIERWIILGFAICHPILQDPTANELWNQALTSGWVLPLFRDEVLYTHNFIQVFFESIKGYSKKVNEVKDCYNKAIQEACLKHR